MTAEQARIQKHFRALVEDTCDWIWETDTEARYTYSNPKIKDLLGYEPEEILGQRPTDLAQPSERNRMREIVASFRSAPFQPFSCLEIACLAKNGSEVVLELSGVPVFDPGGKFRGRRGIGRDITARRRSDGAIRQSEERFRTLVANIPDVVWTIDADLHFVYISPTIERLSGFALEDIYSQGARIFVSCIHPDDVGRVHEALGALFADGRAYDVECRVRRKSGEWIWVHDRAYSTYERAGMRYADGILSDITTRKQAEESLRVSEENYRRLVANLPDVTWTADARGHTTYISPNVTDFFGYTPAEIYTRSDELWLARIHPADQSQVRAAFAALFEQNRSFNIEYRIQRHDGQWIWLHDRSTATYEANGVRYADGLFSDITPRKQAEQMLRESEERFRSLIECTRDWVWEVDAQGRYTYCSPKSKVLLGYEPEEILGRTPFDLMEPDEAERVGAAFAAATLNHEPIRDLENTNLHKDGQPVILETSGLAILGEHGDFLGYRGIDRDITQRRRFERELRKAKEAAEAANHAKGEFLANMSHEIRTPMNGILGMVDLTLGTELTAEQRDYLSMVKSSAESLMTVINDILDFSKIEAGKLDFESITFDLREAFDPAVRALAITATSKGLRLDYFVAPEIPRYVVGDPGRLRQILLNLVGNALKFTANGRVAVRIEPEPADLEGVWLHLTVADTGIGIAPQRLESIFNAFAQADTSTTRRYGGTGLGLTIARNLAEMMDGRLSVDSVVGQGSTFHCVVRLGPAAAPNATAESGLRERESRPARSLRSGLILVVEDNPINQTIAANLLRRHGFEVELAGNGKEALEKFRQRHFDAVLMDVQMPEMDGFDATAGIREIETVTATHVPVIAMTAHAMKGDRERCLSAGMDSYISKPVRPEELFEAIDRAVLGNPS